MRIRYRMFGQFYFVLLWFFVHKSGITIYIFAIMPSEGWNSWSQEELDVLIDNISFVVIIRN